MKQADQPTDQATDQATDQPTDQATDQATAHDDLYAARSDRYMSVYTPVEQDALTEIYGEIKTLAAAYNTDDTELAAEIVDAADMPKISARLIAMREKCAEIFAREYTAIIDRTTIVDRAATARYEQYLATLPNALNASGVRVRTEQYSTLYVKVPVTEELDRALTLWAKSCNATEGKVGVGNKTSKIDRLADAVCTNVFTPAFLAELAPYVAAQARIDVPISDDIAETKTVTIAELQTQLAKAEAQVAREKKRIEKLIAASAKAVEAGASL